MLWRRATLCALIICALLVSLAPPADSQNRQPNRQNAEQARQGEDDLEDVLRRFGPEAAGLKEKIDQAIAKGVEYMLAQQQPDGRFNCYNEGASGYPMGGTAFCALAIKKSMSGLFEGENRDVDNEVRSLERLERQNRLDGNQTARLQYLRTRAKDEILLRKKMQAAVDKALDWIRNTYNEIKGRGNMNMPNGQAIPAFRTYDIGVVLMLLEGYFTQKQPVRGGTIVAVNPRAISPQDKSWIQEMVNWLASATSDVEHMGKRFEGKGWRYPGAASDGASVDNSNIQYAVLGLKAAQRMGVNLPDVETWRQIAIYFMATQEQDGPVVARKPPAQDPATGEYFFPPSYTNPPGNDRARGWRYLPADDGHHPVTGAMTTAALAALIMAKSALHDAGRLARDRQLDEKIDASINDGMAWLTHNFSVAQNPVDRNSRIRPGWHYYYLYGLERVGVLAQTEFFGTHAWYPEGAKYLVGTQRQDGAWDSRSNPNHPAAASNGNILCDTAFALLFLKRATMPVNVPLRVPKPVITGE